MAKIKKGDNIIVISGKDKGKKGKISEIFPKKDLVLVEGVNVKKKHQKPSAKVKTGQIIDIPKPIHISNVMLEVSGKKTRAGYKVSGGKKVRISRKTGKEV